MSNNLALALSERAVNGSDTRLAVSNMQYGVNPMSFPPSSNHLQQPLQPFGIMRQECEEQLASERRLRNREHAKRSRVRKKFMLESLQLQVRGLQDENSTLRMLVQQHIPHEALNIIDTCCSKSVLFADPMGGLDDDDDEGNNNTRRRPQDQNGNKTKDESDDTATKSPSPTPLLRSDFSLIESLTSGQQNFVLSDPRLPDNPIVYASSGFYELTGYTREQVLGRNCRFLQGSGTSRKAVDILRTAVANGTDATVCLLNYKADGTPFWNQLFVAALRDGDNCIVNYVSSLSSWIEYLMLESFDLCVACVFFLSRPHLNHLLFLTHSHRLVCKH
jgi:PAS domain S-box-containing protein